MIAVKVNPAIPDYSSKRRYEIRTLVESGAWSRVRRFSDAATAIDALVREGHISEFRPYSE
jgi:hypothetical protein